LVPLASNAATLNTLYSFTGGADGGLPVAGLIYQGGFLYGTTKGGGNSGCPNAGASGCGTLFKVDPTTGAETVVYSFTGGADGGNPEAGLIYEGGLLYGTTPVGGASLTAGTVFKVDPTTGAETVVYSFTGGADGGQPQAGVIYQGGFLYGTTRNGGTGTRCPSGCGTVFRIDATTGGETVLYSFSTGSKHGYGPYAGLTYQCGSLYGTTVGGGAINVGTIFKVNLSTGAETVLLSFTASNGAYPFAGLLYHDGSLYGTTVSGGSGCAGTGSCGSGTVFKVALRPRGGQTVLHSFSGGADGGQPYAGLIYQGGFLYGTTKEQGGASGYGTVFRIDPVTGAQTVLHSFSGGADGAYPSAGLIYEGGVLYGTTTEGGASNSGTVFSLTP